MNNASRRDYLTKTSNEDAKIELTEKELRRVIGGALYMKYEGIDGAVTTEGHAKWIEL